MKTTERIKMFFSGDSNYEVQMTKKYINEIADMTKLLERAETILGRIPRKVDEILFEDCPEYDWLADFEKFQEGS